MTDHLYIVLSKPPETVSDSEYQCWYAKHARENIEVPSFRAVRRYRIEPSGRRFDGEAHFSHLALYEYNGDLQGMRQGLQARIDSGAVVLPPWFDQVLFQSWDATAVDERVEASHGK